MADVNSAYYPYERVYDYATLPHAEEIFSKVVNYLLDLPEKEYTPRDDNELPRCRLNKLLYWDCEYPLEQPLPTPAQKVSIVFDPDRPDLPPDKERQYRILPFMYPGQQAEYIGRTSLKIYMGKAKMTNSFRIDQAVTFEILTNSAFEGNVQQRSLSRTYDIAVDILRSLNGVNMDGVGAWYFDRRQLTDCGLEPIWDKAMNVGYLLTMGLTFMGGEGIDPYNPYMG